MDMTNPLTGEIKSRYTELMKFRQDFLDRAYKYSAITLPYILPENEDTAGEDRQLDYSSVGAEYVNHLSNVYADEMFPSHRSFFKLQMPTEEKAKTSQASGKTGPEIDKAFAAVERECRWKFEQRRARGAVLDFLKHLIITGNSMLYVPDDEEYTQNYAMDQYVLWRDVTGKVIEIITKDKKSFLTLSKEMRDQVLDVDDNINSDTNLAEYMVDLYTYIRRDPENSKRFLVDQSVDAINVGEQTTYPENLLPWIPCFWNRTRREVWGRGLIEDHYGAFYALSILSEALVTAGAIATDFKFLIKPGSVLDAVAMNEAESGTYHYGDPTDVGVVDVGKAREIEFVAKMVEMYKRQLGKIFLVLSSQMRDAERVTAEENRLRAQELNKAHGGVFGNLSVTLQKPIAELLLRDIDVLIQGSSIEPVVMTGLDAMGRMSENEKILYFFNDLAALANVPEEMRVYLKPDELMTILGSGRDIDTSFVKTKKEAEADAQAQAQAEQQQMAAQSMVDKAEPEQIAQGMQRGA